MYDKNLKSTIIHLKSLDQKFDSPIVAGAGNANGRSIIVTLEQETLSQIPQEGMLYLNWQHNKTKIKGYNSFMPLDKTRTIWEFKYPKSFLVEGDVLCCIDIVDSVSICSTSNFIVHVLSNPNDGFDYTKYKDFNDFQKSLTELARLNGELQLQLNQAKLDYNNLQKQIIELRTMVQELER